MAIKTSILIFYLGFSKYTQKVFRYASWVVLAIVNLAGVSLTFLNIFQCRPVNASFDHHTGPGECIPLLTEFICSAPVNIVTDLAILALPIPVLTGLRLPPRQKAILVFTFTLGLFVTVVNVVRIYYLQHAITDTTTDLSFHGDRIFGDSPEFSWDASLAFMWSVVEVNVGIICACIPTLRPLIINLNRRKAGSGTSKRDNIGRPLQHRSNSGGALPGANAAATSSSVQKPIPTHLSDSQAGMSSPDRITSIHPGQRIDHTGSSEVAATDLTTIPDVAATHQNPQPQQPLTRDSAARQLTSSATTGGNTIRENAVHLGFMNMERPKSMLKTSISASFKYCTVITVVLLLVGFSYGLLNILNDAIAAVSNISGAMTIGLTSAYFGGGYFFGPLLVGQWTLHHDEHHRSKQRNSGYRPEKSVGGFKATFVVGLCIYGIGTIMFWPSAVLASFPGFLISNFVSGFGLGVLETAINPFLALCGPSKFSEMRSLLAQGAQGVGSTGSLLLAQKVFLTELNSQGFSGTRSLLDVQWTYLALTLFCAGLALFFYYIPLPEVADAELDQSAQQLAVDNKKRSIGGLRLQTVCLALAVLAQWTYVAARESVSIFFKSLLTATLPMQGPAADNIHAAIEFSDRHPDLALSLTNYGLIARTAFAVSRFFAGGLAYIAVKYPRCRLIPTPRTVLMLSTAGCVLFAILFVVLRPANANLIFIPIVLFYLCQGPLWPLIFAIGLRGQGKRTKRAGVYLSMGGSGPLFWPFVMYGIIKRGGSVQIAFVVVIMLLVVTMVYPLYLTFGKDARILTDPHVSGLLPEGNRSPEEG
jgi:fucose permease